MSARAPGIAVVDAGHKAVAIDSGLPLVWQRPGIRYVGASDEHGKLAFGRRRRPPKLGEKLRLVPGHCDPTVDRYDWYVGRARRPGGMPVAGRGPRRRWRSGLPFSLSRSAGEGRGEGSGGYFAAVTAPRWIGRVNSAVCPGPVTAANAGQASVPCVARPKESARKKRVGQRRLGDVERRRCQPRLIAELDACVQSLPGRQNTTQASVSSCPPANVSLRKS